MSKSAISKLEVSEIVVGVISSLISIQGLYTDINPVNIQL